MLNILCIIQQFLPSYVWDPFQETPGRARLAKAKLSVLFEGFGVACATQKQGLRHFLRDGHDKIVGCFVVGIFRGKRHGEQCKSSLLVMI